MNGSEAEGELETLKRLYTELRELSKHFWAVCDSYFIETEQDFYMKELYHVALQLLFFFFFSKCGSPAEIAA